MHAVLRVPTIRMRSTLVKGGPCTAPPLLRAIQQQTCAQGTIRMSCRWLGTMFAKRVTHSRDGEQRPSAWRSHICNCARCFSGYGACGKKHMLYRAFVRWPRRCRFPICRLSMAHFLCVAKQNPVAKFVVNDRIFKRLNHYTQQRISNESFSVQDLVSDDGTCSASCHGARA